MSMLFIITSRFIKTSHVRTKKHVLQTITIIMHYIYFGVLMAFIYHNNDSTHALKEHAMLYPVTYLMISYASSRKGYLSYSAVLFSGPVAFCHITLELFLPQTLRCLFGKVWHMSKVCHIREAIVIIVSFSYTESD